MVLVFKDVLKPLSSELITLNSDILVFLTSWTTLRFKIAKPKELRVLWSKIFSLQGKVIPNTWIMKRKTNITIKQINKHYENPGNKNSSRYLAISATATAAPACCRAQELVWMVKGQSQQIKVYLDSGSFISESEEVG